MRGSFCIPDPSPTLSSRRSHLPPGWCWHTQLPLLACVRPLGHRGGDSSFPFILVVYWGYPLLGLWIFGLWWPFFSSSSSSTSPSLLFTKLTVSGPCGALEVHATETGLSGLGCPSTLWFLVIVDRFRGRPSARNHRPGTEGGAAFAPSFGTRRIAVGSARGKKLFFAITTEVCPPKVAGVPLPPRHSRRARGRTPARRTMWTSYSSAFLSLSPPHSKLYRRGRRPAFSRTQCHYPQTKLHNKWHNPEQILWTGSTRD